MASLRQTPFRDFHLAVAPDSEFEHLTWELASILFDEQDAEAFGIPNTHRDQYDARLRKDRLIAFWRKICKADADQAADNTDSQEEQAIAYLSANSKEDACEVLARARDYRLMTLVAQIGGNGELQEQIASQIDSWRELNVLSEMSEPIRALYSLLAGNTCICEGKQAQHIEDKAASFAISERFKLDWKRAFNLRLCYAIKTSDPIEAAVEAFVLDCQGQEPAQPGDDVMFCLLQLYAAHKTSQPPPSLESVLLPKDDVPSAMSARLSFQLYFALKSHFPSVSTPTADTAVKLFAAQLDSAGEWLWALWGLLHISELDDRQQQVKALLSHHAKDIHADPPYDSNKTWQMLTRDFQIPEATIWEAKAFHARTAERDRVREAAYLVKAKRWKDAHEVLTCVVGPACVIAEEWAQLQGLLEAFKPGRDHVDGWGLGGQVYADYLSIMLEAVDGKEKVKVLKTLLESLRVLLRDADRRFDAGDEDKEQFHQRVALQEMSSMVGREVIAMREKGINEANKLHLLKKDDAYSKETAAMSERYREASNV